MPFKSSFHLGAMWIASPVALCKLKNGLCSVCLEFLQGQMPALLSHYRPDSPIYAFTENRDIQRRLALYHGITALYMPFTPDADQTFDK